MDPHTHIDVIEKKVQETIHIFGLINLIYGVMQQNHYWWCNIVVYYRYNKVIEPEHYSSLFTQ